MTPAASRLAGVLGGALTGALVTLGVAAGSAVATDAESATPEETLAERYAPVMMLVEQEERCGSGEPYLPRTVDPLFGNAGVALRGPWTSRDLVQVGPDAEDLAEGLRGYQLDLPGNPLKPGCDYESWARSVWGDSPRSAIYAHVATERGVPDRIAVQYFFYYPFNDFNNKHESDWERIQVEFPVGDVASALASSPDRVIYAQHYGGELSDWDDDKLTLVDGTHPVVYVSAGSHASQYGEGLYIGRSATEGFGCDTTVGPHDTVIPDVLTIPADDEAAAAAFPWIRYDGHWGEIGPQRFYEGPTGPNRKRAWTRPFTWSDVGRATSFSIPGAEVAGNQVSEFVCSMIGRGSDGFRRFAADPWTTLAVLAAGLFVLGWLLRRTDWRGASALPARRVRSTGQVVAAAWLMLRSRPGVFLAVAVPSAALSIVASVAQSLGAGNQGPWWVLGGTVLTLLLAVTLVVAQLVTAQAVSDLDAGRPVSVVRLNRAVAADLPRSLGTVAVHLLVVIPLFLSALLSPLALVLVAGWSLTLPVVQLERRWGPSALRRSRRLVRRQVRVVVPVLLLSVLLISLMGGVLAALVFLLSSAPFGVVSVVPGLVTTLVWPFTALLTTYAYYQGIALEEETDARPSGQQVTTAGA